ncbi:transcriptional repressor [candidate division WOR-3 bacterium]|nr:transcriptional repressor [candidate division WOR-3 bacterium]
MKEKTKNLDPVMLLKEVGLSPTMQRVAILRYLLLNKNHPTVNMIYRDIRKEIPTLSKTSVYNSLDLFRKHNLVFTVPTDEDEKHYDLGLTSHSHFICRDCNKIYDIESSQIKVKNIIKDHEVEYYDIVFYGVCKECKKGETK